MEATHLAYPEPIPEITGHQAKEFLERLKKFKLTAAQKKVFRGAKDFYNEKKPE